jgi:ferric-dicitrate binding protein FerR (iron transport regulator)
MPYKDPERKRQWEREHREQRNARRRTQRLDAGSGQRTAAKPANAIAAALGSYQKPVLDPASDQKPQGTWKAILGLAVGIGVVLLAALASVTVPMPGDLSVSSGSGNSGM